MQALLQAIAAMQRPTDAQRVFHGRGGLYPGCEHWVLDAFPPVWVLTSFQAVSEADLASVGAALSARWSSRSPRMSPSTGCFNAALKGIYRNPLDARRGARAPCGD